MGQPWRENIRNFTPSWFAVSMGVGVQVSLLHIFPYPAGHEDILHGFAAALLITNIILFFTFTVITALRYWLFPELWHNMIHHPVQGLYVGCFPMALATIINGLVFEAWQKYHIAGEGFLYFIWGLWLFDLSLALACNWGMFYVMITRHKFDVSTTFSVWLLPIVPTVVLGTTGCLVADALTPVNAPLAFLSTLMSTCSLAFGLTMSLMILVLYVQRLILHGFPAKGTSISVFLPLGPLGQGGYGLLLVGNLLVDLLPNATSKENYLAAPGVAQALGAVLFACSIVLWALGNWFLVPAVLRLANCRRIPFGVSWWGLIFPSGVYAVLTLGIAQRLHSSFLNVLGTIYTLGIFVLFLGISIRTVLSLRSGAIFNAPCLNEPIATKLQTEQDADRTASGETGIELV